MEPEILKKIAEYIGYTVVLSELGEICLMGNNIAVRKGEAKVHPYHPKTNNDQMVEIIEKLKLDVIWWPEQKEWSAERCIAGSATQGYCGKTINEAVLAAASELVKDK